MLRMSLLGGMRVWLDDAVVEPPASRRAWLLLAWLGLHPGLHPRGDVAATFWPDVLDSSARASLRSALWALRKALGDRADDYLHIGRDRIGLLPGAPIQVDAEGEDGLGELLPGYDDEWVIRAREAHQLRMVALLESRARDAKARGDTAQAVLLTRQQVQLDPHAEQPVQRLMRRLADAGDRAAALTTYQRFRDRLDRELGIRPAPETERLAQRLRSRSAPEARRSPRQEWPLTGRDRELAELRDAWARARGGRLVVASIVGEPGIGKTRLAGELCDLARAEGAVVASATALDLGVTAPLGPWAELIGGLDAVVDGRPPDARWAAALAPLSPAFGSGGDDPATATATPPDLERARLYEGVVGLLQWVSDVAPTVLLMEDLHAADPATLDLIGYACRRLAGSPVLVVLTRRLQPLVAQVDALEQSLRARRALTTELTLRPLAREQSARLVREVATLPPERVTQVVSTADGNPLLAVEWAAALARGESAPPPSLRASVRTALAPLHGDALHLAQFAAVAGRSLEREEIAVLPLSSPREAVAAAAECSLLDVARGRVGYRHALLREAAYVDLPEPARERLHESLGQVLSGTSDQVAAEAARHLRLAGRDDLAIEQLVRAAQQARRVAALDDAASLLRQAVELDPGRADLLIDLAEIEAFRVNADSADEAFARALPGLPGPAEVADAWVRRARWYAGALCHPERSLHASRTAVDVLDDAGLAEPEVRIEALARWAWAEIVAGDVATAERLLEQVHALLGDERPSDAMTVAIGHARALALVRRGRFRESYGPQIAAAEAGARMGRVDLSYGAWAHAACTAGCAGEFDRALEFVDRGLAEAVGSGLVTLEFHLLAGRAHILGRLGRDAEAWESAGRQREIADRLGDQAMLGLADHDRGLLALALGRYDDAAALIASALRDGTGFSRPTARLRRAESLVALGRPDEAEEELRRTTQEPVTPGDFPEALVPRMCRIQGLIARHRGDPAEAEARLEEAAAGWRRLIRRRAVGDHFAATIADFGRPPLVAMVEPETELERVRADLDDLAPAAT